MNNIEEIYPLAPLQGGLLFHSLYESGSGIYVDQITCQLKGRLDVPAFQQAWQRVVDRHAILRTSFLWEELDEPLQIVRRLVNIEIEQQDWSKLNVDEQEAQLANYLQNDHIRGFDLTRAPLLRLSLLRLGENLYQFVWSNHHAILDGWSRALLLKEVLEYYEAERESRHLHLPAPRPYRDYIAWLQQQELSEAESFWQHSLAGFEQPTPLPLAHTTLSLQDHVKAMELEEIILSQQSCQCLQQIAHEHQLTLSTLLQGAWALLLSRLSGQLEVVFGVTVSGRSAGLPGIEQMVGLFINTLPLRARIEPQQPLLSWLQTLQAQLIEIQRYEYTPLARIQGWSAIPGGIPLFESILVFENYPIETSSTERPIEIQVQQVQAVNSTNYPLTVVANSTGHHLRVQLLYAQERFAPQTIQRLLRHLQAALEGIASQPHSSLGFLLFLPTDERDYLLRLGAASQTFPTNSQCLHQIFEAQVQHAPDAIALVFEEQQLTYHDLNRHANQLAHRLLRLGVGPEVRVGLCLPRSLDLLIGLLAILKAGGIYVPLDPTYPAERLSYLLADSHAAVLLTQPDLLHTLPPLAVPLLLLEPDKHLAQEEETNPEVVVHPMQGAYVIYTSGSTGQPKGVLIPHCNVIRLFAATVSQFGFGADDCWTLAHSLAFDFSVWEIWGAWLYGGRLVVLSWLLSRSPQDLLELIEQQQVTVLNQTPSAFGSLLEQERLQLAAGHKPTLGGLRWIIFGGEALQMQRLRPWWQWYSQQGACLVNMYGITETTIHVTAALLGAQDQEQEGRGSRIGLAIPDLETYILDQHMTMAPIGVPGELYVGGAGLARGYLGRPELTAERFVPNPFSQQPGARLYRTGDLVSLQADGQLIYLGRLDAQVKIRGFRIELGEIEAALRTHPAIHDTVVVARQEQESTPRLVAYVVFSSPDEQPTPDQVRQFLQQRLPDYMLPASFVELDRLPVTVNGKVDRDALPAPQSTRPDLQQHYIAPQTPTEQHLAQIWQQVLHVEQVGMQDNFFTLGGDSILSIQVVTRARQAGLLLTPRQIFQHPTIAQLAALCEQPSAIAEPTAEQEVLQGEVPLTPIQHWFLAQEQPHPDHANQAILLHPRQPVQPAALAQALSALLQQHDGLRLRFRHTAQGHQQHMVGLSMEPAQLQQIDLRDLPLPLESTTFAEATQQVQASLHLQEGPLMRAVLFERADNQNQRLLLVIHHLAVDAVSWRILLEDLHHTYQQALLGQPLSLPAKTSSYQQWAERLLDFAQQPVVSHQLTYWSQQMQQTASLLPCDGPEPEADANTWAEVATTHMSLTEDQTLALLQRVSLAYHTQIQEVLLAALLLAWTQQTGQRSLRLDLEGHGRQEEEELGVDLSRTIGWFTTLYPVVLRLENSQQPGEVLKQVKEQLRQIPLHGLGYGLLRYLSADLTVQEQLARADASTISFDYLGQSDHLWDEKAEFMPAAETAGPMQHMANPRPYMLSISTLVAQGQLQVRWHYSRQHYQKTTIEQLAQEYLTQIQRIIAHCQSLAASGYTPSDFPLATVDQETLDQLLADQKQCEDIYALSPMQQGLLFHSLYEPGSGVYVEQLCCRIRGAFNRVAFRAAWQQVIARHPILRTSYHWTKKGEPLQLVHQRVTLPWEEHDWRGLTEAEQQERLNSFLQSDRTRGFDLAHAPLMRLCLFQLTEDIYQMVWTHHHVLLDGWSVSVIFKEVFTYYDAEPQRQTVSLPRPHPYRDYIAWLQQQDMEAAEQFWKDALHGFITPTPLPMETAPTDQQKTSTDYALKRLFLSETLTEALQHIARRYQITLSTIVQGMWALLLSRYSREEDVVFGMVVSGRPATLSKVEYMVGLFINTLPVRVQVQSDQSVSSWLQQLQEQLVELRQYEYSPLAQIQKWCQLSPGVPLFKSVVAFDNYPIESPSQQIRRDYRLEGAQVTEQANYPLVMTAVPGPRLRLQIGYLEEQFASATVELLLSRMQTLLEGVVSGPEQHLDQLSILQQAEQEQLLARWYSHLEQQEQEQCLHHMFEKQVVCTPDAIALQFNGESTSYAVLNAGSNQLAWKLLEAGASPGNVVVLLLERRSLLLHAILAILKAGCTFVCMDTQGPQERLERILTELQPFCLLTEVSCMAAHILLLQRRNFVQGTNMLVLDQPEELDEREGVQQSNSVELAPTSYTAYSQTNPDVNVDIQTTAYIAYTSGSTGTPKGILQSHRNMCQFIHWFSSQFQIRPEQRIAQWSSFTFDAAYVSILSTLCFGATLCLTTPSKRMDPAAVIDWLGREQINQLETVPSFLRSVVAEIARQTSSQSGSPLPALEFLLLGGEVVPVSLAQNILQLPGRHRYLYNLYGPTESTLATFYEVRHVQPGQSSVPIGNPIPGRQILILDEAGRPCPDYIVGEIVIRGSYLSEGYFRQPQETQKTFQADPFTARSGLRLYRTGDLGRWLADGTIEYCGRKDMQVKIRGMRVELEEIEAVLQAHTSINACAVAIHSLKASSDPVDQHLVAYVVANRPETEMRSQGLAEFQDYLKNRLPGHMRPAAWVFLEQLPRTSTGKVDRRALPPPDWQHMGSTRAVYKAPRTPLEEVVAGIWAEVLHIEQIGRDDNFFALGGHSLLATQVIVRLRDIFQRDLPLSLLFEAPTVAQLGASIEQTREVALHIPPLQPMPRQEEIALSFAQQRLWFLDQWEPGASLYNAPLAIQLGGNLQWQALLASMQRIVERHEALRTTFANQQGLPRQVIAASLAVKMPLIDLSSLPEEIREQAARQLTIQEAQKPFNLAQGPLLRACLLRLHQQTHVLLITLHHIITDGWSMDILLHELSTCYQALIDNQQPQLPALAVQYTDYALWQRQWLQGTVLDEQLNYWQERLADLPMLDLPVDYPYPPVQSYRGAVQRFALPHSLLEGLQQLCQREGVTLFMALLAAFQTLLARYSGQEDIVVGTTIANRSRPELEGLIGFFANTLVLRTDLRGDPAFQVLLGRVRKTCLEAYTYQDLPFERLVEELHPERNISRPPLVQVLFVLQNAPVGASSLSDLELQPIERKSEHTTSRFELTVSLHESTQGLSGTIEYCTDLFNATTIKHLVEHWHLLLEGIVAQPALRLSTLPLLRSDERELLLHNWNMTERHYSQPNSLHQLFEVQVQSTPDAIALTFEEQQITYAELNERANQLAHALRRLGIRSESLVGLGVERSLDMVIGLLGILKAGGAYVPLEPEYPGERLSFLLQDTGITVILTQQKLRERFLASTSAAHVLCLDTDASLFAANPTSPLINITQPAHLAYVIYTSGSTGTPKGVMNTHKGVSNRLAWMQETYQLHGGERVLQKTPFSFDVSVWEFFWPLMTGACLVIARPGGQRDSSYLRQLIVQQHISTLHFVPSMLQAFLIENGLEQCRGLKRVICSGETLPFEVVHTFHHKLAGVALHNLYGPTEAAIDVTYWRYQPESELTVVPIGRPVANTQLYVLDTHMQPVPIGSTGELYIGGIQLARGYLNRPELTAERFVPDPFRVSSDARLYRTGDLVRYLPDGNLEFLGRLDQQVKIRGFRIEPGEIEATLRKHPEVREVVVVTQEEATAEKRLIAYVVPQHEQPASSALREYMLQRLPDYTLPSAFVFLESLPLTTNGKINRGALPAPDAHRPDLENVYMPPQTPLQQTLVEIWQQVLRLERVGIHDNFFLVGGHSLLAAQVVARVRTTLNVEIAVRLLFEKPTIADLAGAIGKLKNSTPPVEEQPLQPVPRAAYRVKRSSLESDSRGG